MSQYHINDNTNCFNTNSFNNVWNNYTVADDRSQLLTWLSPLDPRLRHRDIQERRVDDVGEWLLKTEEFRSWYDWSGEGEGDNAVLFCCGDPGVGKTFMSSLVVDRLCDQTEGQNMAVACFYFDFATRKEQSATRMLGSLLKQVVSGMEEVPEEISRAFQAQKRAIGRREPQLPDIVKMLQTVTSSQRTFMCIDALDECAAVHRVKLLDSLKQILEKSPGTKVFVTGRPHIRDEMERRLDGRVKSISVGPSKDDIIRYLRVRLGEDETPDAMDESLEADILEKIPENISEMFLLVSLNIDAILQESTTYRRREKLSKMTHGSGLGDAYDATIERIKAQGGDKSRLGMAALMWISHAERPLQADELCHALAVELGSTDFNACNIPSILTLVGCCQGLITVEKESSTVRLIHFTLQEYLSAHPDIFSRPHSTIAETCLTYLNSPQVKALSADPFPDTEGASFSCSDISSLLDAEGSSLSDTEDTPFSDTEDIPFSDTEDIPFSDTEDIPFSDTEETPFPDTEDTPSPDAQDTPVPDTEDTPSDTGSDMSFSSVECASLCDSEHTLFTETQETSFLEYCSVYWGVHAKRELSDCARSLTLKLLQEHYGRKSTEFLFRWELESDPEYYETSLSFSGLHCASFFGIAEIVSALMDTGRYDINERDFTGCTPLGWAAHNGHEEVVKILLEQEEVNPDQAKYRGQTPLALASENGHVAAVKILLVREGVSPDKADNYGRTPLSYASGGGHERVVKILLGRGDVDPDKPDISGRTPLSYATRSGHEGVVKILLGRGKVNPDKPDDSGQTPLSHASWGGHDGVVKILLGREDVDLDKPDKFGQTPLSFAAAEGHEGVVKSLLVREGVSPNEPDYYGRTPLSYASGGGYEKVVEILLGRGDVDPDKPDNSGRTPFSFAVENKREGVVKILLGREDVSPDRPDNSGRTPLSFAAGHGRAGVVEILLGKDIDPDKPDNSGRTPFSFAVENRHEDVVKSLLGREEVNPDKPDSSGRTPLSFAAGRGRAGVVEILLGRGDIDPDEPDNSGRTPFSFAVENGHEEVAKSLLGREEVDPDKPDNSGRTPLSFAAGRGREGVVKILLGREDVSPDRPDNSGRTPLSFATARSRQEVIALLQSREVVNPSVV